MRRWQRPLAWALIVLAAAAAIWLLDPARADPPPLLLPAEGHAPA